MNPKVAAKLADAINEALTGDPAKGPACVSQTGGGIVGVKIDAVMTLDDGRRIPQPVELTFGESGMDIVKLYNEGADADFFGTVCWDGE